MEMLLRKEGAVCSISQMEELGKMRRKGIISDALNLWPLGIVRMFSPDIRLTGRYMSVLGRDDHPSLIRKASSEVDRPQLSIDNGSISGSIGCA